MDIGLSIGIGLMIFGIGLYSRKWAGWLSFLGFFPFVFGVVTGILGFIFDSAIAPGLSITGTYMLGVVLGWIPYFFMGKQPAKD